MAVRRRRRSSGTSRSCRAASRSTGAWWSRSWISRRCSPGVRPSRSWTRFPTRTCRGRRIGSATRTCSIGSLNIQHLESLNDLIQRNTGVRVRETVPDSFLEQADQVVNLDLAVEDLVERLKSGKIYPAEKIPWALEHFFQDPNLATLRELSLREVAESLDRTAALALPRRGSRLAGRLNTDWFVVYVETPQEAPHRIDSEAQRHLLENVEKARELGAEVVRLQSDDPATALLDFARSHRVSDVIVGRTEQARWRRLIKRSVLQRLVDEGGGLDLHIVSFEDEEVHA